MLIFDWAKDWVYVSNKLAFINNHQVISSSNNILTILDDIVVFRLTINSSLLIKFGVSSSNLTSKNDHHEDLNKYQGYISFNDPKIQH